LCDLKIQVPGQVSLVGCDGIEDTEYPERPLTTLVQPVAEMCVHAWRFLVRRMDEPTRPPRHVLLKTRLVVRESSVRPA
jgi:DNA-binding LacI/PurR family transcriptional regulator